MSAKKFLKKANETPTKAFEKMKEDHVKVSDYLSDVLKDINKQIEGFNFDLDEELKEVKETRKARSNKKTPTKTEFGQDYTEHTFGPYLYQVQKETDGTHCVIRRSDGTVCNPSFYELQYIKNSAFGGDEWAVEVFPSNASMVDGQHQRHLWKMNEEILPNLKKR